MFAAREGHTATAAELVRLDADINAKTDVRIRCSCARGLRRARLRSVRSELPLPGFFYARLGGNLLPACLRTARGTQYGRTALDIAKQRRTEDIVELLTRAAVRA